MAEDQAPGWPFVLDAGGVFPVVSGDERTSQEVAQAVLIRRGSLPMEKGQGSILDDIVFENEGETRDGLATEFAREAVESMVPGVAITDVKVTDEEQGVEATIDIGYDDSGTLSRVQVPIRRV